MKHTNVYRNQDSDELITIGEYDSLLQAYSDRYSQRNYAYVDTVRLIQCSCCAQRGTHLADCDMRRGDYSGNMVVNLNEGRLAI